MNLNKDLLKLNKSFANRIISEDKYNYECHKLNCVASKYALNWRTKLSADPEKLVKQEIVNEDFKELHNLYQSRIIKESVFVRDLKKIVAVCEDLKLNFPGPKSYKEAINIEHIASVIKEDEFDLGDDDIYNDLEDEDEYEDEDEETEFMFRYCDIGGHHLEEWSINSDTYFKIDGSGYVECCYESLKPVIDQLILDHIADDIEGFKAGFIDNLNNQIQIYIDYIGRGFQASHYNNMIASMRHSIEAAESSNTPEEIWANISEDSRDEIIGQFIDDGLPWVDA